MRIFLAELKDSELSPETVTVTETGLAGTYYVEIRSRSRSRSRSRKYQISLIRTISGNNSYTAIPRYARNWCGRRDWFDKLCGKATQLQPKCNETEAITHAHPFGVESPIYVL